MHGVSRGGLQVLQSDSGNLFACWGRVVLVDEDYGAIGEANLGFSESADGYESLGIPVIH
jgi:hypothetical protein